MNLAIRLSQETENRTQSGCSQNTSAAITLYPDIAEKVGFEPTNLTISDLANHLGWPLPIFP